jgi:hypothetical protein
MRSIYVSIMRALRAFADKTGLLAFLESRRERRLFLYLRSLFSIYDVDDMARLDLPWWTFTATAYVETFLKQRSGGADVFEYGPGASTVWLAKRARRVAYVEHDEKFATVVQCLAMNAGNVSGVLAVPVRRPQADIACPSGRKGYEDLDFANYVATIRSAGGPFDLIVIDGRARTSCLKEAVKHIKPDGAILFDNSRRSRYRSTIDHTGLYVQRFRGLAPALPYIEETAILTADQP